MAAPNTRSWLSSNAVALLSIGLTLYIVVTGGVFTMRDRVTRLESESEWRLTHLETAVERVERTMERRAHDVANLLHQPADERGADQLLRLFSDETPNNPMSHEQLAELAAIMHALGEDRTPNVEDGTRSLAMELSRLIELRLEAEATKERP